MNKTFDTVEFCFQKEAESFKKITFENLTFSELREHEILLKIQNGLFTVLKHSDTIDQLRFKFLINTLAECGLNFDEINFTAIFNLGDDVPHFEANAPRLCFSKRKEHHNILLPDAHFPSLPKYKQIIDSFDVHDFESKKTIMIFAGSDTGLSKDPAFNQRFQFCLNNQNNGIFKISNFVTINKDLLSKYNFTNVYSNHISIEEQLQHRYILNINGNTTSWDRLLWAMYSKSVCLWLQPPVDQRSWYYPLFDLLGGPIMINEDNWQRTISELNSNIEYAKTIAQNQKILVSELMAPNLHLQFFKKIIEEYNKQFNL